MLFFLFRLFCLCSVVFSQNTESPVSGPSRYSCPIPETQSLPCSWVIYCMLIFVIFFFYGLNKYCSFKVFFVGILYKLNAYTYIYIYMLRVLKSADITKVMVTNQYIFKKSLTFLVLVSPQFPPLPFKFGL